MVYEPTTITGGAPPCNYQIPLVDKVIHLQTARRNVQGQTWNIPSGKRSHSYGTSPFVLRKLTINDYFQ